MGDEIFYFPHLPSNCNMPLFGNNMPLFGNNMPLSGNNMGVL